ncbi:MAG: ATP-binding protein [Muribaculaceae bacterium]|nr:ATP-binding protein [Muribaculaceae bacterium]
MLFFPPRSGAAAPQFPSESRRLIVVGANGAGKTRFASRLAADLGRRAYCLSALRALYASDMPDPAPETGIDAIYERECA